MEAGLRRTVIVALAALGFSLAALSVAWACTEDAVMYVSEYTPAPGQFIQATGHDYYAAQEVNIHWQSREGPVLATAVTTTGRDFVEGGQRGSFAVDFAIPADAAPGDHLIVAVSHGAREKPVKITIPGEEVTPPTNTGGEPELGSGDEANAPVSGTPEANTGGEPAPTPGDGANAPASAAPGAFTPAPAEEQALAGPAPAEEQGLAGPAPAEEQVLAGANQAVAADPAPEGEPAPAPVVNTDWRNTHGALLHAESTPVVNTDWRSTHGALLHAVPDSLQVSDRGAFADAVAASEADGSSWAGAFSDEGPMGIGAGLALFAPGLMLLFGGFTVAAVARRREKAPVTYK